MSPVARSNSSRTCWAVVHVLEEEHEVGLQLLLAVDDPVAFLGLVGVAIDAAAVDEERVGLVGEGDIFFVGLSGRQHRPGVAVFIHSRLRR